MKTNFPKNLLLVILFALAGSSLRADEEQDLIATLQSNAKPHSKCAACVRLRIVGTTKSVPSLAALLGEERTAHAARYALEGMPFPEAATALRQALAGTSGLIKAGLIDSLGWRRDAASVPLLTPLLSDGDATLAAAAASALGRIGGKEATAALTSARDKAPPAVQSAVMESLLLCGEALLAEGDGEGAAKLYRSLFVATSPDRIRAAAWRGLVLADSGQRGKLMSEALVGADRSLHIAALKVLREVNDPVLVKGCLAQWDALPADAQLGVLDAVAKLGPGMLPAVQTATQSPHLSVRVAAWQALGDLGDASTITALAKAAAGSEPAEREAAREALSRVRGTGVRDALLRELSKAPAPEKAELLRALGERDDRDAADVLLQNAAAGPNAVRRAALESLRRLALAGTATPLVEIAAKTETEAECEPVLKALYAACQASADKEQASRNVLEVMGRLPAAQRCRLLPVLGELGTTGALEAAQAAARSQDPELSKQAVRVLGQWPSAAAAPGLLELARAGAEPALQVLALRGCIATAGQEPDLHQRLEWLKQARAAASRPEEQKQALGQIGQIPSPEALTVVMADLADPSLSTEAALAAVTIAEKLAKTDPKLASEVGAKVREQCKTPEIVKRAEALCAKPTGAGPSLRD